MSDCPNCGSKITEVMKFCSECGINLTQKLPPPSPPPSEPIEKEAKLEQELMPPPPPPEPIESEIQRREEPTLPAPPSPQQPPPQYQYTPPIPPLEKQKSKKPLYALAVVNVILGVAIALVIIFAALNNGSESWYNGDEPDYWDWEQPTSPPRLPHPPSPPDGSSATSAPSLFSPKSGSTVTDSTLIFDWEDVLNADEYQINVDDSSDFSSPIIDKKVIQSNCSMETASYKDQDLFWRVRTRGSSNEWSHWSTVWSVYIGYSSFSMNYRWSYKGDPWYLDFTISGDRYYYYKDKPRSNDLATYVTDTDDWVEALAQEFKEEADKMGYDSYDTFSFIMAFVQSLPYTSDDVTTGYDEYPRYPVETLVDNGGDCEDTAILLAALVQADPINFDTVLFLLPYDDPNHVATGVWGDDLEGVYYEYNGRRYYYCETTGDGWKVGEVPPEYEGVSAEVIEV